MTNTSASRVCECGEATIYFKTEDAGKTINCPKCERQYMVFLEMDDNPDMTYELYAEPTQELLLG